MNDKEDTQVSVHDTANNTIPVRHIRRDNVAINAGFSRSLMMTNLMYYVREKNIDGVKKELEQGLDIEDVNSDYKTALYKACSDRNDPLAYDICVVLVNYGAQIYGEKNGKSFNYCSALIQAIYSDRHDIVKMFLTHLSKKDVKPNLNLDLESGIYARGNPMYHAKGKPEMIKLLVEYGCTENDVKYPYTGRVGGA